MKLLNFHTQDGVCAGLVRGEGVEDLSRSGLWQGPAPVRREELSRLADRIKEPSSDLMPLDSLRLAPVVLAPEKIICVGLNYRRHAAETHMDIPRVPALFSKFANSLSGHGAAIALPDIDEKYDYEAELGVVIGREGRDVPEQQALDYVAGYCCANDLTARTVQFASSQWTAGKIIDGFLPTGPYLATFDEVPDPQALEIGCFVNGQRCQGSSTGDMIFSVAKIIAFLSRLVTLKPGDLIATGTPAGVQAGAARPVWLKPGDEVSVEISGLGRLSNRLVAPSPRRRGQ